MERNMELDVEGKAGPMARLGKVECERRGSGRGSWVGFVLERGDTAAMGPRGHGSSGQ